LPPLPHNIARLPSNFIWKTKPRREFPAGLLLTYC
jgi:hypothetical protein